MKRSLGGLCCTRCSIRCSPPSRCAQLHRRSRSPMRERYYRRNELPGSRAQPMTIKLGMCGFTIGARAYYKQFRVVEVQQTFYDPPPPETLERWRSEAPVDFEFTMKAWQVITHRGTSRTYRRLRSAFSDQAREEAGGFRVNGTVMGGWKTTLHGARILNAKIGR